MDPTAEKEPASGFFFFFFDNNPPPFGFISEFRCSSRFSSACSLPSAPQRPPRPPPSQSCPEASWRPSSLPTPTVSLSAAVSSSTSLSGNNCLLVVDFYPSLWSCPGAVR
jgi:hypothetical protein